MFGEFEQAQDGKQFASATVRQATRPAPLTDQSYWDDYWNSLSLPRECTRQPRSFYQNAILDVFDRHLPTNPSLSIAEVGGAPGQYLAYMHKHFGYRVTCVDFSATGCQKTTENFRLLGIPGDVIQADIFADDATLPLFDVVYSLGLIEHFADRTPIVERHVSLLKPGGYLVLGVPNFRGVNGWFMRSLGPDVYAAHDIEAMDLRGWRTFEERPGAGDRLQGLRRRVRARHLQATRAETTRKPGPVPDRPWLVPTAPRSLRILAPGQQLQPERVWDGRLPTCRRLTPLPTWGSQPPARAIATVLLNAPSRPRLVAVAQPRMTTRGYRRPASTTIASDSRMAPPLSAITAGRPPTS